MGELVVEARLQMDYAALTRETVRRILVEGDDGAEVARFVRQASLLSHLRAEVRPGMEAKNGGGAGGPGGSPAPLAIDALDLLQEIEEEATRQWWIVRSDSRRGPGLVSAGRGLSLEQKIGVWVLSVRASSRERVAEAAGILHGWVGAIEGLFDPVHRMELLGACPECGATHVTVEKDGEPCRAVALTACWSAGGGAFASCAACSVRWSGFELHALAEHVTGRAGVELLVPAASV